MRKWKTIWSEYHYKTPFGNLRKDTCELPNGMIINDFFVHEYEDWVNAVVLTKDNQIVLVEQYRYPGQDFYLEIPAGKIEQGESYEQGILRELREETGFTSLIAPIKLGEFMVNPATQTNKVVIFLILDAFKAYDQELDDTEELEVRLLPFDSMGKMIREKKITQLFSVSAYYMAKDFLRNSIASSSEEEGIIGQIQPYEERPR
ncbi:NUDIX hydrolase [Sporosarcina limicola]|uniref:8-oxo-dGTP pyrophosphatase MutT (NUDIX family) n=1 Tax=Sporosarcina limicola TaxID=34101 RepID=A0A927R2Q5_9BACL|nr:NUDIX hydrolase [Sporosarcina limicola]MBE1554191.1 8-oxo-dGTP pyrophosphatase MutT (NUDIX family) [Sporosarcina limicola]